MENIDRFNNLYGQWATNANVANLITDNNAAAAHFDKQLRLPID